MSNTRWASDITEIRAWNGQKVRLAIILDCGDRMVLAWRLGSHITGEDLCEMLREALYARFGTDLRQAQGLEFLSDNGPEYLSKDFQRFLTGLGMPVRIVFTKWDSLKGQSERAVRKKEAMEALRDPELGLNWEDGRPDVVWVSSRSGDGLPELAAKLRKDR